MASDPAIDKGQLSTKYVQVRNEYDLTQRKSTDMINPERNEKSDINEDTFEYYLFEMLDAEKTQNEKQNDEIIKLNGQLKNLSMVFQNLQIRFNELEKPRGFEHIQPMQINTDFEL